MWDERRKRGSKGGRGWFRTSERERLLRVSVRPGNKKRPHWLYVALGLPVFLLVLVGFCWWLTLRAEEALFSRNPHYTLRQIEVTSEGPMISEDKIREALSVRPGTNLFAVDIAEVRRQFLRKMPAAKSMVICRRFPGTLGVRVSERVPLARLGRWKTRAVDREGYVYELPARIGDLPEISGYFEKSLQPGTPANGLVMSAVVLLNLCSQTQFAVPIRVSSVDVANGEYLDVRLRDGERVRLTWEHMETAGLDAQQRLTGKLERLASILKSATVRGRRVAQVDLTFTDQYIPVQEY